MGRPTIYEERVSMSLRVPKATQERIHAAAAERGVSANWLILHLVEHGLDRLVPVDELVVVNDG
jgi:predicted HicB family RNase H-like nuclease